MNIKTVKVGYLQTNCYIIEYQNNTLIIDPGDEAEKIIKAVEKPVVGIIVTHHHFDHVGALDAVKKHFQTQIYDIHNLKEGENKISDFNFEIIYTPGHKEDLISILMDNNLFCGDFIFENGIGRFDLEGGNFKDMQKSILKILKYDPSITIYPGHGDPTTLKKEISNLKNYV